MNLGDKLVRIRDHHLVELGPIALQCKPHDDPKSGFKNPLRDFFVLYALRSTDREAGGRSWPARFPGCSEYRRTFSQCFKPSLGLNAYKSLRILILGHGSCCRSRPRLEMRFGAKNEPGLVVAVQEG